MMIRESCALRSYSTDARTLSLPEGMSLEIQDTHLLKEHIQLKMMLQVLKLTLSLPDSSEVVQH